MSDYQVLELPNVLLQKGGMLPTARLAYKTLYAQRGARQRRAGADVVYGN